MLTAYVVMVEVFVGHTTWLIQANNDTKSFFAL